VRQSLLAPLEPPSGPWRATVFTGARLIFAWRACADLAACWPDMGLDDSTKPPVSRRPSRRCGKRRDPASCRDRALCISSIDCRRCPDHGPPPGATRLDYGGRGSLSCWLRARGGSELSGWFCDGGQPALGRACVAALLHLRGGFPKPIIDDMAIAGADGHGITLEACGGRSTICEDFPAPTAGGDYAIESRSAGDHTAMWGADCAMRHSGAKPWWALRWSVGETRR